MMPLRVLLPALTCSVTLPERTTQEKAGGATPGLSVKRRTDDTSKARAGSDPVHRRVSTSSSRTRNRIHCTSSSSEARTWAAGDGRQRIEAGLAQIRLRSRISTASGPGMSQSISPPKRATPYDKQRSCRGRFKARSLGLRIQAIDRTIAGQTKQAWATWNRDFTRNLFHIDSPLIGACLQA